MLDYTTLLVKTRPNPLFVLGEFVDTLTEQDWDCLARIVAASVHPYSDVLAVPRGRRGSRFAEALQKYRSEHIEDAYIIADQVWTAESPMAAFADRMFPGGGWRGVVAFAGIKPHPNVKALFMLGQDFFGRTD